MQQRLYTSTVFLALLVTTNIEKKTRHFDSCSSYKILQAQNTLDDTQQLSKAQQMHRSTSSYCLPADYYYY